MIEKNPYRYKSLKTKFGRVFRVRINIHNKKSRLIYKIIKPKIILICLLERKNDYKELELILKNI